jgi:hypothetical protein
LVILKNFEAQLIKNNSKVDLTVGVRMHRNRGYLGLSLAKNIIDLAISQD